MNFLEPLLDNALPFLLVFILPIVILFILVELLDRIEAKDRTLDDNLTVAIQNIEKRGMKIKGKRGKLSSAQKDEIMNMYKEGISVLKISKSLNIPRTTVRRFLGLVD
jgi:DNA invertase Pin-like site-specific DNA recombinase